jgi:iron complex outermembrane receptor protein
MWRDRGVDVPLASRVALSRQLASALPVAALLSVGGRAQEVGTLLGTVRDFETGRPVVGAVVTLDGTRTSATTDAYGRYWLLNLGQGTARFKISGPGYVTVSQELRIRDGEETVAHFHLQHAAVLLERLVVKGERAESAGPGQPVAHAAVTAPVSLVELLDRVAPGMSVRRGSGQVGAGTRLELRGAKSLVAATPPLVLIDGVRVEYASSSAGPGTAGASVLDMLDPAMIDSIRVMHGAEAARYGMGTQNGVILITTRQGRTPRP